MIPNTDKVVEQQERSSIAGGNAKWYSHFGNSVVVSSKTKHTVTIRSSNCTPWYLPKGIENLCPHTNLLTDVYSSFIHIYQSLEAIKMFFSQ